jgi:DNA-binding NtrC family response regulator
VVDDEDRLRHAVLRLLERIGCEATGTADGADAGRLASEIGPLRLLLLDATAPGVGAELVAECRRLHPAAHVVVMSGYGATASEIRALTDLADGFLEKPFDLEGLRAAVEPWLG